MARVAGDDLRSRVLKAWTKGASARLAAARFGVGVSRAIGLLAGQSVQIGHSALSARLRRHGWTYKKSAQAMEQDCPDLVEHRGDWFECRENNRCPL